jgi:putative transposase
VVVLNASTSPMKEGYAVFDSNVIKLAQPGVFTDSLTEVLRSGARALLTQAVEAEVAEFLAEHADLRTVTGHQRVVRHGHLPEREIMTGIGPVAVRQPRVRDREAAEGERIRYSPSILPRYARRSKSLEVLIPILYLKGISTGDFEEALASLVGKDMPGLSASTIARRAGDGSGTPSSHRAPARGRGRSRQSAASQTNRSARSGPAAVRRSANKK